jgi:hypothetical protein
MATYDANGNLCISLVAAPMTQPISGTVTVNAIPTGGNVIGHVIVDTAPSTAVTNAGLTNIDAALSTRLKPADTLAGVTTVAAVTAITNALPAGANVIGHVIVDSGTVTTVSTVTAVTTVNASRTVGNAGATMDATIGGAAPTNAQWHTNAPATASAAATTAKFINASGAAANVKASAGNLYGFSITNETAAVAYIEFFNTASAPTLGTTVVVFAIKLPASANITIQPSALALMNFTTGIGFAVTTAENGSTPASVTGMIFYL